MTLFLNPPLIRNEQAVGCWLLAVGLNTAYAKTRITCLERWFFVSSTPSGTRFLTRGSKANRQSPIAKSAFGVSA